jgi:hypothetical protein
MKYVDENSIIIRFFVLVALSNNYNSMPSKMTSFINFSEVRKGEKRIKFFLRAIEIMRAHFKNILIKVP